MAICKHLSIVAVTGGDRLDGYRGMINGEVSGPQKTGSPIMEGARCFLPVVIERPAWLKVLRDDRVLNDLAAEKR